MEQELLINRNLIYYYENISLFINFFKQIYYKNRLFFQGTFDNKTHKLESGKLYDLANDSKTLIYDGKFINGLPSGVGKTNSCSYIWLNGCIFSQMTKLGTNKTDDLDYYHHIDISDPDYFQMYKQIVSTGVRDQHNRCKLHFSKNYEHGYPIITDTGEINELFDIVTNTEKQIDTTMTTLNKKHTIYYFNECWQTPVITEYQVFHLYYNLSQPLSCDYFAFPWATMLDQLFTNCKTDLLDFILNYNVKSEQCFTVCQHIAFRKLLPLFKRIGITHVFASHCSNIDVINESRYGVKIIPFQLYAFNEYNGFSPTGNRNHLCSFTPLKISIRTAD